MSWSVVPLNAVCEIIMGQAPVGASYNENSNGLALIAGAGDFGNLTPIPKKHTTEASKISKVDDLILCIRATIGDLNWSDKEYCLGRGVAGLRPIAGKLEKNYLWHFITANKDQLAAKGTGSTFKQVSKSDIAEWEIPLPPLDEQKRIAAILDKADSLRRKRQQAIQLADEFLRAVFLDLFGDPVTNPKGWEIKTIEQLVKKGKRSIKRGPFGGALKKEIFVNSGYLVYEQYHALNNDFTFQRYFIDENKYEELKAFDVTTGDIIISCSGVNLGRLAIVPENSPKGIINQALLKISLDNNVMLNEIFTAIFSDSKFKSEFFGEQRGSGVPNFPPISTFKEFRFICPPMNIQQQYLKQINIVAKFKQKMATSNNNAENLFNSLSQKAFAGEL